MSTETTLQPQESQPDQSTLTPTNSTSPRFPVVGIGASAGGIAALQRFFTIMPDNSGMAFVVILHLSPNHESHVAEILAHTTSMPVTQVMESTNVQPNHVYVIPPTKQLTMIGGKIELAELERSEGRHVSIDHFFRTLAETHTTQAVCIILSGTGADGSEGIKRVKETGGVAMVQDPRDAEYDGMPRNAINTGMIDWVLPVEEMPDRLLTFWQNASKIALPEGGNTPVLDIGTAAEDALQEVLDYVLSRTGHDFRYYKRATILRRIERRMQVTTTSTLPAYNEYLQNNTQESALLLQDLLIGVTNFFRDRHAFERLEREVVPLLFDGKTKDDIVRVWVAGCSSGEEAYSVAILLMEHAERIVDPPKIQVFATDIDEQSLTIARAGVYSKAIEADVSPSRLREYFITEPGGYRIANSVRENVLFAMHNLIKDPPFSRIDLVTCRNMLIYLQRELQTQVFHIFHFALRPGGFLFLGSSESVDDVIAQFTPIDKQYRIFRTNTVGRNPRLLTAFPSRPPFSHEHPPTERSREQHRIAFSELHYRLLESYAPPSIVVNSEYEIVHLSNNAGRFIRMGGGEPTHNVSRVLRPELQLEIRNALFRAFQTGESIQTRRVQVTIDGHMSYVTMVIRPETDKVSHAPFALIVFDEVDVLPDLDQEAAEALSIEPIARQLETEVQYLRQQLQATIEQSDSTVEELKTSNEEMQAINEELRSTAEELETSKEELQSVNEELRAVNDEMRLRIEEIGSINNDLQNLIASTDIAIMFLDRMMRIKSYTPRAIDIFNAIPADEGRPLADITHNLLYPTMLEDAVTVLRTLQPIEHEVKAAGGRYYVARLAPYRTVDDRIAGVVLTFVDITRRIQMEAEREQLLHSERSARIDVETALRTRDQFLSVASHELRTPLTSMLGYAQILHAGVNLEPKQHKHLTERIVQQAQHLNGLIGQLLDISRLQQGQFVVDLVPIDIAPVLTQVIEDIRASLRDQPKYTIETTFQDGPTLVAADKSRLAQVFFNLLNNAIKYSPHGGVVHVRLEQTTLEAVIEVEDEGIGIPAKAQAAIFTPFYRAANTGSHISGFGLGLHVVQEIVQQHRGRIEFTSVEGEGSLFRVFLPLATEAAPA